MTVLDASAVLALLQDEPGTDEVEEAIDAGAAISAVNYSEVLGKMVDAGARATQAAELVGGLFVSIEPFGLADATEVARIRGLAPGVPLSFGDRACLALARRRHWPVLTADRAWLRVADPLEVRVLTLR